MTLQADEEEQKQEETSEIQDRRLLRPPNQTLQAWPLNEWGLFAVLPGAQVELLQPACPPRDEFPGVPLGSRLTVQESVLRLVEESTGGGRGFLHCVCYRGWRHCVHPGVIFWRALPQVLGGGVMENLPLRTSNLTYTVPNMYAIFLPLSRRAGTISSGIPTMAKVPASWGWVA
ncbi:hypothetical protein ACJJTC_016404 [Scirpophaga incertulas]